MSIRLLYPVFFCLIFISCTTASKKESPAEEIVAPQLGGEFRGISIGDDYEKVLNTDPGNSLYSMPDEIVYRLPVIGETGTWYEITYNFNEQGLYDICLEIFPHDTLAKSSISMDLLKLYQSRYGSPDIAQGYTTWRMMTANAHVITVSLTDTLLKHKKPMIQVRYNESGK